MLQSSKHYHRDTTSEWTTAATKHVISFYYIEPYCSLLYILHDNYVDPVSAIKADTQIEQFYQHHINHVSLGF